VKNKDYMKKMPNCY